MAVIWADFPSGQQGLYGTNRNFMLNGIWAGFDNPGSGVVPNPTNDPDPSIGANGKVLGWTSGIATNPAFARFALPGGATTTVGFSFRLWLSALPSSDYNGSHSAIFGLTTTSNVNIVNCTVLSNGAIAATTTTSVANQIGITPVPVIVANAWNHIEIKTTRSSTVGEVEIRVNGVTVLALTNLNLGTSDIAQVRFGQFAGNSRSVYYKDIIIWDNNGAQNNDFLGECIVRHLIPESDVTLGGWTTSSGSTGFNLLAQSPPVDTNYIAADDSPPALASFELTDLPPDIVTVKALLPITRSRKVDGGDGNLQTGLTGTLTDLGADNPITTAFTYRWDVSELSPDTGTPWTPVEVDAVKLDIDRTL